MPWKKSEPMEERTEFAVRAMRTLNFRALCQEYGISAKTGYKWRERFWRKGLAGMEEESRRPKSHFRATARGGSVRNCALEAGARGLGTGQDPGAVFAAARRGGQ